MTASKVFSLGLWGLSFPFVYSQEMLPPGQVIDTVRCLGNQQQSYALYLPSYYDTNKQWPIIYIFEPSAHGRIPVKIFKKAAEEFGYITMASNNSRNGPWKIMFEAADAMIEDSYKRFSVNPDGIYTSGFSGGSRAASSIAVLVKEVKGVIACGAGFAPDREYQPDSTNQFVYVGIVGDKDMNYLEHKRVEEQLELLNMVNRRIVFQGRHRWPDEDLIYEAIAWLELQQLKKQLDPSKEILKDKYDYFFGIAEAVEKGGKPAEALRLYQNLQKDFKGFLASPGLSNKIDSLTQSKEVTKIRKDMEKVEKRENKLWHIYYDAISELHRTQLKIGSDSTLALENWWKTEIDFLKKLAQNKNYQTSLIGERLLNMVSANFVETRPRYIQKNDFPAAIVLTQLWIYIQPESVYAHWTQANNYALAGDKDLAFQYLELAYDLGMSRIQSLTKVEAFNNLRDDPRYFSLIEKMEKDDR